MFFLEWQYIPDIGLWGFLVNGDTAYDAGWKFSEISDVWDDFVTEGSRCVMRYWPA